MLKLAATALWICAITLGSVYASIQFSTEPGEEDQPSDFFGGLDYVRGNVMSVPVIADGQVHGYFLTRLVFTAEPEKLARMSIEPLDLITDELYTHLIGNEQIDFSKVDDFDVVAFREGIRDALNERVGETIFHEIIIEQVDYITKEEIRSNMQRRRQTAPPPPQASMSDEAPVSADEAVGAVE